MAYLRFRSGAWRIRWLENGVNRERTTRTDSKREAEKMLARFELELANNNPSMFGVIFSRWAAEYLDYHKRMYPDSHTRILASVRSSTHT